MPQDEENILLILSSPSGAGKTTLTKKIQQKYPNFKISVSHTTRSPRENEIDGVDYHFVNEAKFKKLASLDAVKHTGLGHLALKASPKPASPGNRAFFIDTISPPSRTFLPSSSLSTTCPRSITDLLHPPDPGLLPLLGTLSLSAPQFQTVRLVLDLCFRRHQRQHAGSQQGLQVDGRRRSAASANPRIRD